LFYERHSGYEVWCHGFFHYHCWESPPANANQKADMVCRSRTINGKSLPGCPRKEYEKQVTSYNITKKTKDTDTKLGRQFYTGK